MKTMRAALVIVLIAAGVIIGYLSGQGSVSAASDSLTAQDYADIQQLYWLYNHGADFHDGALFASAFSEDAVLRTGLGPDAVGWTHRSTGVYEDVYVKTSEGWRIKSRTLNFDKAE